MEALEPQHPAAEEIVLNRNYLTSQNVRARFELYSFAEPEIDIEATAIGALNLDRSETVVDIGAADGSLLQRMRVEYGHTGHLIGVEPNFSQVDSAPLWQPLEEEVVIKGLARLTGKLLSSYDPAFIDELTRALTETPKMNIDMHEGSANDIPLPDKSADILMAMFMLYHVPKEKQAQALAEFKRVLKDDGVFVMATSGRENKRGHRLIEEAIADILNIQQPKTMNNGFDTEKAIEVVPEHFQHAYVFTQESAMTIDEPYRVGCYLNSLRSLRDQFDPIPSKEDFEAVLGSIIAPVLHKTIERFGVYADDIRRSIIIASDKPLDINNKLFTEISK